MAEKILIIEDNVELAALLKNHLLREGYEVSHSADGVNGLECALSSCFDLIVCDIVLPRMNGLEICQNIREKKPDQMILMLSSKDSELDMVTGLELGADDYVAKPFTLSVLLARVRALLRRGELSTTKSVSNGSFREPLRFRNLTVDIDRRRVFLNDAEVELTAREFDIIAFLAGHAGRPFTREQLVAELWDDHAAVYSHSVNALVSRIRAKIEVDPAQPIFLRTVRGHGYRFTEASEL